jgi:hypothetical protein
MTRSHGGSRSPSAQVQPTSCFSPIVTSRQTATRRAPPSGRSGTTPCCGRRRLPVSNQYSPRNRRCGWSCTLLRPSRSACPQARRGGRRLGRGSLPCQRAAAACRAPDRAELAARPAGYCHGGRGRAAGRDVRRHRGRRGPAHHCGRFVSRLRHADVRYQVAAGPDGSSYALTVSSPARATSWTGCPRHCPPPARARS